MDFCTKLYQCVKSFTLEDACIVIIMIIPKLLILLPILLIAEGQNDSQRPWSNRLPIRRPVITPGFRPESTLSSITKEPVTTKKNQEFVTQQHVQAFSNKYEELTTKGAEIANEPSFTSETVASNKEKVGFTIIFSSSYTESPITTSSLSPPPPSTTQRPIQRLPWSRPINRPQNYQPSTSNFAPSVSTVEPSPSTAESLTLIVAPVTSTIAPYTSTAAPSTLTSGQPMSINPYPVSQAAPSILTDEDNEIAANLLASVAAHSISTVDTSTSNVANVEVAAKINQEPGDTKPGYTIIFKETSTKKPKTIDPPPVFGQPIQNPAQTDATNAAPVLYAVNQNTVSYIPTETTNLPNIKPIESYSIIFIKNNNSDPNVSSQQIAYPAKEPSDATTAQSQNTATTAVEPVTNKVVIPTSTTIYTTTTSTPIYVRPLPPRPIPFRPTASISTASTPLIVVAPFKVPSPVTYAPVTTPAWRTTTTYSTISTTTHKPPTAWTTLTTSNPPTAWNPHTQSDSQSKPSQTNVINQLQDYICRDVSGYYPLENKCDEYILCKSYIAYKNTCPDGLHFNPVARYPAYPCAYPTEVKCQNLSAKQPAKPTGQCPHRFGHFLVPSGDCGHFMMCQEGVATIMACPPGLAFNEKISACDWSVNVPGCNPSAFEGFICPVVKSDTYGYSAIVNYGYKNSCKNYIACHEGHPRLLSCDTGLSFDEATAKCVESSLVQNCRYLDSNVQ